MSDNEQKAIGIDWPVTMRMIVFPDGSTEWEFDLPEMAMNKPAASNLADAFRIAVMERAK